MEHNDYDILFSTETKYENKAIGIVEYDSTSNKPFMVYELNKDTLEYESYSGEDTLNEAIQICYIFN